MPDSASSPRRLHCVALAGAGSAVALGTFALLAWGLGRPEWAGLIPGLKPTAPGTALLLILFGGCQFLEPHQGRKGTWVAMALQGLGALLACFWVLSALAGGRVPGIHLGFAELPGSGMSPVTALGLLLAAGCHVLLWSRTWAALPLASLLAVLSVLAGLAQGLGVPRAFGLEFAAPSLTASLAMLALSAGLLARGMAQSTEGGARGPADPPLANRLLLVGLGTAILMVIGGFLAYRHFERQHLEDVHQQLAMVVDLKAEGLRRYRRERQIDGDLLAANPTLAPLVQSASAGSPEAARGLRRWLQGYIQTQEYDLVRLVDAEGRVRMMTPEGPPLSLALQATLREALATGQMRFQDLYRSSNDQQIRMALVVPLFTDKGAPLGAFVLRMDPRHRLWPYLSRWPSPSPSGETLLVRREGAEAVFLNPLRFEPDAALNLRFSAIQRPDLPAVRAIQGLRGATEGRDYRGVHSVANTDAVAGTPWHLVARIDRAEAYGPLRERLGQLLVLGALITLIVDLALGFLYRQRRVQVLDALLQREVERRQLETQLARSQKMESLGSLAGGVAHDMNNVLSAILGLASAHLRIQTPGSAAYKAFETIEKAARRGGGMVRSLLDFARQGLVEEQDVDLNAVIREEAHLLERTTLARVRLQLDLDPTLRPVCGDAGALSHLLMNLCVNAVDAMPEGGTLTLRTSVAEGDRVVVEVADTGCGMSPEVLAKAMEPFYTTKPQGKGTGLGLAIVYGTVKAHRGTLDLQSEPGRGTRVRITFPASELNPSDPAPPMEGRLRAPQVPMRILVADDDDIVRGSLQTMLELLGHTPVVVASGEAALRELAEGLPVGVVILDLNMPGLGGAGTLPRLRQLRPGLPVLLATGRADQAAIDLAAAHLNVHLVAKPFSLEELREHLEALAGRPAT